MTAPKTVTATGPRPGERRLELPNFHNRVTYMARGESLVTEAWAAAGTNDVTVGGHVIEAIYDVDGDSGIRQDRDELDAEIDSLPMLCTLTRFEVVAQPDDILGSYLLAFGTFTGPSAAETRARIEAIQAAHGRCADECPGWSIWVNGDPDVEPEIERCEGCLRISDGTEWPVTEEDVQVLPEACEACSEASTTLETIDKADKARAEEEV